MSQKINSLASLFLIVLFLLPDGVRSAQAWDQLTQSFEEPLRYNGTLTVASEIQPRQINSQPEPAIKKSSPANSVVQTFPAIEEVAYLGKHPADPMNQASNDVFRVEVSGLAGEKYAILSYEVNGLANGLNLPKSINGAPSYVGGRLEVGEGWQHVTQAIPLSQLREGMNLIRFHAPHLFPSWVEVKNVQVQLSDNSGNSPALTQLVRQEAHPENFTAQQEETTLTTYQAEDVDMPSIPRNVVNVTRDSWGYLIPGSNAESVKVKIGVDQAKIPAETGLQEVQIFYFDHPSQTWQVVQAENIDMSKADMEGQGPGGTNYFAGLIKTPEMPEASAFAPTAISGIQVANPAAEMNIMQPPSVSHTGEANINYPLIIPAGRQGMQPNINLTYSSDAGTGWMGVGWNINVPAVSIDTRWGVPTFDATEESEVYSLNGESLTMEGGIKANRNPGNRPALDSVHFFTRTMHAYKKIIRYGTDPTGYYWEEVSAGGTHFYYGTLDGSSLDTTAVLRDGSGNVLRWYLRRIQDKWGNYVTYNYAAHNNTSTGNIKSGGKELVLDNIRYTGYGSTPGNYEIVFETSGNRQDARVMMNLGEKILDDRQLNSVKVNYYDNGTPEEVKRFDFHYINGDFDVHPLLEKVVEYRSGEYFYKHSFEYHHSTLSFHGASTLEVSDRNQMLFEDIPNSMSGHRAALFDEYKPSGINTTTTRGGSGGGGIGLGVAPGPWPFPDKTFSFSARFGWGNRYTRDKFSLEDFNGDGLPDLVYDRPDGGANYAALKMEDNGHLYLDGFNDINYYADLLESNTSDFTYGFDFTMPLSVFYYGRNWKDSRTETSRYLTDYNADGIKDLVVPNGQNGSMVLFGELDLNKNVSFNPSSESSLNPVVKGLSPAVIPVPEDTLKDLEIVRSWIAPYDGYVNIGGYVYLDDATDDHVYVAIQKNSSFEVVMTAVTDTALPTKITKNNVQVDKSDTLTFRLRCNQNGYGDLVQWNPSVTYTSGTKTDGNGSDYGDTDYEEGFLLSAYKSVQFPADRSFKIDWPNFTVPQLSDEVTLRIRVSATDTDDGTILQDIGYDYIIPASTQRTPTPDKFIEPGRSSAPAFMQSITTVPEIDTDPTILCTITFEALSTSNVDWQDIGWRPQVEFGPECGEVETIQYPTVFYHTYNRVGKMDAPYATGASSGTQMIIWPRFNTTDYSEIFHEEELGEGLSYPAFMVVKGNNKLLYAVMLEIYENSISYYEVPAVFGEAGSTSLNLNQAATNYSFPGSALAGGDVYIEYFAPNDRIGKLLADHATANIYEIEDESLGEATAVEDVSVFFQQRSGLQDYLLGWGQFCWSKLTNGAIPTAKMRMPYLSLAENNDYSNGEPPSTEDLDNNRDFQDIDPKEQEFWPLLATRGEEGLNPGAPIPPNMFEESKNLDHWSMMGTYVGAYRSGGMAIPGKLNEEPREEKVISPPAPGTYGAVAYPQVSTSFSLGQTSGTVINGTGVMYIESETIEDSEKYYDRTISTFMDFNGDGYPDLLSNSIRDSLFITLTDPMGGHRDSYNSLYVGSDRLTKSINVNEGDAASGTFINNDKRFTNVKDPGSGFSKSLGYTDVEIEWQDLNGDGLPDRIHKAGSSSLTLELNNGKGVLSGVSMSNAEARLIRTFDIGLNATLLRLQNQEAGAGFSFSYGSNFQFLSYESEKTMVDMNGDGLVDMLELVGGNAVLYLNNGTSFNLYNSFQVSQLTELERSEALGVSTTGGGTFAFPVFTFLFFNIKTALSGNGQGEFSINRQVSALKDMNGDGYADLVRSEDGQVLIYPSAIGQSNLLKKVTNPLKGSFTISYARVGNRYGAYYTEIPIHTTPKNDRMVWDMPESKWVMDSLVIDDGLAVTHNTSSQDVDGWDTMEYAFRYDGGIKSRREREFLGFTRVETRHRPNREDIPAYSINNNKRKFWISEVTDYFRPYNNGPQYRKRFEYMRGLSPNNYVLLHEQWKEEVEGPSIKDFDTITLVSQDKREFEFRDVGHDRGDNANFNKVLKNGQGEFDAVIWNTITETQTLFPAVTATEHIEAPDLAPWKTKPNWDKYLLNRYEIKYDNYFNVIEYVDEGVSADVNVQEVVTDTIYNEDYVYYEIEYSQADLVNGNYPFYEVLYTDPVTGDQCYLIQHEDFTPDTVCFPSYFANPPEEPCWDPDPQTVEGPDYTIVLRKLVRDTVYHTEKLYNTNFLAPIIAWMEYFLPDEAAGRTNALKDHKIFIGDTQNGLTRHSHTDSLTNDKKAVKTMAHYQDVSTKALTSLQYDAYGNVIQLKSPDNHKGQRLQVDFTYDSDMDQFITGISNSYGDQKCMMYDPRSGKKVKDVDVNGNIMGYHYDEFHRLKGVYGPRTFYNSGYAPTIAFDYYPSGIDSASASSGDYRLGVPVAITSHNIHPRTNLVDDPLSCWNGVSGSAANDCASLCDFSGRPAILDPLQTATFMDGMQRVVQVKKEVSKATGDTANLKQKLVSGITQYDRQGRDSTITLQTEELSTYALGKLNTESSNDYQAKTAYDYVSRPVLQSQIREASGSFSETTTAYEWNSLNGDQTFSTLSSTHGLVSRTYLNNKGQTLAVTRSDAGTTWFTPDPLNQLLKVIDPVGDSVLYQYDFMGQVTQEEHTDKGVTSYTYDKAGNMRTIERAEISPDYIEMDYHYNRLNKKTYPNSSNLNEVVFTYGSRNDGNNGAGRVIRVNEGTNFKTEIYKYDALGNRIYEEKVMSVPQAGARTFVTEFTYDDWGRIRQMVYPRGEVVDYSYGLAGELEGVNDNSMDNPVVDLILYDGFGNIQTLKYGNGTVTNFTYSDYSRRLKTQKLDVTGSSGGVTLLNKSFDYDNRGNVHNVANSAQAVTIGPVDFGGWYDHTYNYDDANRLEQSISDYGDPDQNSDQNYLELNLSYNDAGGITDKEQINLDRQGNAWSAGNYDMDYAYQSAKPHQISQVTHQPAAISTIAFLYNDEGSITRKTHSALGQVLDRQDFLWDEEQRLVGVKNGSGIHHYVYDHNGERIMKTTWRQSGTAQNGQGTSSGTGLDPYIVYANAYFVATHYSQVVEASKHYYMGSQRVASALMIYEFEEETTSGGGGGLGGGEEDPVDPAVLIDLENTLEYFGLEEGVDYSSEDLITQPSIEDYHSESSYNLAIEDCDPGDEQCPCEISMYWAGDNGINCEEYRVMYWYHPDYLGHNEAITNQAGQPYQYFLYSPFGESIVHNHSYQGSYSVPWRFSGKEFDQETGNYYYGARYYDPNLSIWLSVDPLTNKYPSLSPYTFVANNPVMLQDPDGRKIKWNLSGILVAASMMFTETGRENLRAMREDQYVTYQFRLTRSVGMSYNPENKTWGLVEGDQSQAEGDACLMVMTVYMGTFKTKKEAESRYNKDWNDMSKEKQLVVINYFVKNRDKDVEFIEDNGASTGTIHKMKDGEFLNENYLNGADRGYTDTSPMNESKSNYRGRVGTHESTHGLIESGVWQDPTPSNKESYPQQRELQYQQDKQH